MARQTTQEDEARREGGRERPDRQDEDLIAVDALAPEDVGDPAEDQRADGGGEEGDRVDQRDLARGQVPLGLHQRDDNADHEQVISVGEEAHARDRT